MIKTLADDMEALQKFMSDNEDSMEAIFGDHVRVVATRNGIEVEEYEHD